MVPSAKQYRGSDLQSLLSAALGTLKAHEVVVRAMAALGVGSEPMDGATARRVLEKIAQEDGIVGVTGRVALTRLDGARTPSGYVAATKRTQSLHLLASLLAPTIGDERAGALVRDQARAMGLPEQIDLDQALALLEEVARLPGVTGIAARFAKTRIHLSW